MSVVCRATVLDMSVDSVSVGVVVLPCGQLIGLQDTLGSLRFIEKCAEHGTNSMEKLLRDFHDAQVCATGGDFQTSAVLVSS